MPRQEVIGALAGLHRDAVGALGTARWGRPPEIVSRIAEHAEQDPSTKTNARPDTRADYDEMFRASMAA